MEVIGKFILNLIADSIASLIHDIFVALLTVIMDFVSKMIVSLWDDSVVSAIVSCSSWIAMGVFAVGCILMLYDILEARSEEKAVYMSAVTKNFVSGFSFRSQAGSCDDKSHIKFDSASEIERFSYKFRGNRVCKLVDQLVVVS